MDEEIRHLRKNSDERSGPYVLQSTSDQRTRKPVKPRITPDKACRLPNTYGPRFEDAQIFNEGGIGIFGMMNYSVGNDDVSDCVSDRKA